MADSQSVIAAIRVMRKQGFDISYATERGGSFDAATVASRARRTAQAFLRDDAPASEVARVSEAILQNTTHAWPKGTAAATVIEEAIALVNQSISDAQVLA